jgi:hypothetical protein
MYYFNLKYTFVFQMSKYIVLRCFLDLIISLNIGIMQHIVYKNVILVQ